MEMEIDGGLIVGADGGIERRTFDVEAQDDVGSEGVVEAARNGTELP